jgi:hypothetical protein
MVDALVGEYADGGGIEDVNMLAFALVDHIEFNNPKGLLAEAEDYEFGDAARVFAMASARARSRPHVRGDRRKHAGPGAPGHHHGLPAQESAPWDDDDQSLDQLSANDDGDDIDDEDRRATISPRCSIRMESKHVRESNLPALSKQVTELVLAGSLSHAEEAFAEAADQFGDLAVVEVLNNIPPQVTALHMAGFDGGKMSLATLLVPPKAWADSLAFIAATWPDDQIEDDPGAHRRIAVRPHPRRGVCHRRRRAPQRTAGSASATDHGATASPSCSRWRRRKSSKWPAK